MLLFGSGLAVLIIEWGSLPALLAPYGMGRHTVLSAGGILYLTSFIVWLGASVQAYYRAARARVEPFQGVDRLWLVGLCALLVPGWGQFLNGQPKKGLFFLIFAAAGMASALLLFTAFPLWPMFETPEERLLVEKALVLAVLFGSIAVLIWVTSLYDAVKVCFDPIKKEPLHKRIEYAMNRVRLKGFARGVVPQLKAHFTLGLLLIFLAVVLYYYFPLENYAPLLKTLESRLAERQMILIPDLIRKLLGMTFSEG
jgi:hypothetical protein